MSTMGDVSTAETTPSAKLDSPKRTPCEHRPLQSSAVCFYLACGLMPTVLFYYMLFVRSNLLGAMAIMHWGIMWAVPRAVQVWRGRIYRSTVGPLQGPVDWVLAKLPLYTGGSVLPVGTNEKHECPAEGRHADVEVSYSAYARTFLRCRWRRVAGFALTYCLLFSFLNTILHAHACVDGAILAQNHGVLRGPATNRCVPEGGVRWRGLAPDLGWAPVPDALWETHGGGALAHAAGAYARAPARMRAAGFAAPRAHLFVIGLYFAFANAFFEEFFWRYWLYHSLVDAGVRPLRADFAANAVYTIYHVFIFLKLFSPIVAGVFLSCLFCFAFVWGAITRSHKHGPPLSYAWHFSLNGGVALLYLHLIWLICI